MSYSHLEIVERDPVPNDWFVCGSTCNDDGTQWYELWRPPIGCASDAPDMLRVEVDQRPVVFVLHGGPGFDHSTMKPAFDPLAEVAQLVYYDHRGQGRSDRSEPKNWNLDQWADDLRALIDVLGVEKPV